MTATSTQEEFARALLDARLALPPGLRAWNGSDPARRFNVYRNNVMVSLSQALASAFPVTCELVGEQFFRAMARQYVRTSPPASPALLEYGDGFADFIAGFPPASGLPYLADVARLERLRVHSHHAHDAPLLPPGALQAYMADPDGLSNLRVQLHPACRVLRSRFAVVSLWAAHQQETEARRHAHLARLDCAQAEDALVLRPVHEVSVVLLPPGAADFLLALAEGLRLGDAVASASDVPGYRLEDSLALLIKPGVACSLISR